MVGDFSGAAATFHWPRSRVNLLAAMCWSSEPAEFEEKVRASLASGHIARGSRVRNARSVRHSGKIAARTEQLQGVD